MKMKNQTTILYLMLIKFFLKKKKRERKCTQFSVNIRIVIYVSHTYTHTHVYSEDLISSPIFYFIVSFDISKQTNKKNKRSFLPLLILIHCSFASMCSLSLSYSIHIICYLFLLLAHSHVCAYLFTLCKCFPFLPFCFFSFI